MEAAEQFAYIGLGASLMLYLTNAFDEPLTVAAKNRNTWVGVSSIFPLLGGFIADSYLGRFKTIIISSLIYLLVISLFYSIFFYHIVVGMFCFYLLFS
jgi:peptide/histidine transporter 3/4